MSCNDEMPKSNSFISMGSVVTVDPPSILEQTQKIFDQTENEMSEWKINSRLSEVNRMAGIGEVTCSEELCQYMNRAIAIAKKSNGAFDPSWAAVWDLWDFKKVTIPEKSLVEERLHLIDWSKIRVNANTIFLEEKGMAVGLGGFAKGIALEKSDEIFKKSEHKDFMIQSGGQIVARGKSRTIGIRKPDGLPDEIIGTVQLKNQSISTSGDYESYFELDGVRYHHIINPKTGYPSRGVRSVTVISNNAPECDALSTALFVIGIKEGLALAESLNSTEALFIDDLGVIRMTSGFNLKRTK